MQISKTSDSNTIEVARQIRDSLEELPEDPLLSEFDFHMLWDQGESITASVDNLKRTILEGACVAVLVLLFFLRHLRMTCVVMLAIPLSGWLMSSAKGFQTVWFGVLPLPDLLAKDAALGDTLKAVHEWLNYSLLGMVVLHSGAALKHHFIDRDSVLTRMLPRFRKS